MSEVLGLGDRTALLKQYEINVAEGHLREGTPIRFAAGAGADSELEIVATLGAHSARRICPITLLLAEDQITELANPGFTANPQLSRAIAHLVVKLSRMYVESALVSFSINASIVGDHYEVLPKVASIEASSLTSIPRRLSSHAHDRGSISA